MKHKCPCCGYYTFDEKPSGTYDICEVCFWEDDPIQLDDQIMKVVPIMSVYCKQNVIL